MSFDSSNPGASESLEDRLRRRFGEDVDPQVSLPLEAEAPPPAPTSVDRKIEQLRALAPNDARYRVLEALGRGGMGAVYRVWDEDLRRYLAMKVALGRPAPADEDRRSLKRFLEEAQVTGQLDHPGIVPVHELGLDDQGRVYFTMRLVRGRDLREILRVVRAAEEGWNPTRALSVILKVCEAMAYAHSKGVVHRDLKPANVMVGRFGEVYVMDWGLARVLGREDTHDLRLKEAGRAASEQSSELHLGPLELATRDGDIVGTPAYMSPEQALGQPEQIGPRTDVYAVGAMLYELLAGTPPYLKPGQRLPANLVVAKLIDGPPLALGRLARGVAPELVAICEKAMRREPAERYPDMLSLAEDLRAYLEHRVVGAYEAGAVAEFRKWVDRNRALAASLCAAVLVALVGLGTVGYVQAAGRRTAEAEREKVLRLSDTKRLSDLERAADELWPALPVAVPAMERWLAEAERLGASLARHEAQLAALRERAPDGVLAGPRVADSETRWQRDTLEVLVSGLKRFTDPDPFHGAIASMRARIAFARSIEQRSLFDAREAWERARASIADPRECPAYAGLRLRAQVGLVPLGRDPDSGLWEFAHLETGTVPLRDERGRLIPREGDGIVFVLVPGGRFHLGAQAGDPAAPNHDPEAKSVEAPVRALELAPFFLAKHELTQAQWERVTGENPSEHRPPNGGWNGAPITGRHPVEHVSWNDCAAVLRRLALDFPTEAQWEYAARAGTRTPFFTGSERATLAGAANVADHTAREAGVPWDPLEDWIADGWVTHAPAGTFAPNAFGLTEMTGNIWEWCRDGLGQYDSPVEARDGYRPETDLRMRIVRGGGFDDIASFTRSSSRLCYSPDSCYYALGVRPARRLDP